MVGATETESSKLGRQALIALLPRFATQGQLAGNLNQWHQEEVEVRVSGEAGGGQGEAIVAKVDDQPRESEIGETQEERPVLDDVQERLLLGWFIGSFPNTGKVSNIFGQGTVFLP